jgi:predicted dehydrogenase
VEQALGVGCDVVVEKPLAMSSEEAQRMVVLATEAGRTVLVEESYLWSPSHLAAMDILRGGRLGPLRSIVCTFYGWRPLPSRERSVALANTVGWRVEGRFPWLGDHAVHLFALSKRLAGHSRIADVHALGGPTEAGVRGATWRCADVDVVWLRATSGDEGVLGTCTGLHTRVSGTSGCLDVLGEGGAWGDDGPRGAVRCSDGTVVAADDEPDLLWKADVGYYPSAHRRTVAVALAHLAGRPIDVPYFAADAADDIAAVEALIRSAEHATPGDLNG